MGALSLVASLPWPLLSLQLLLTWASNLWLFTSSLLIYQVFGISQTLKSLTRFLISFNLAPCSSLQCMVWWVSNLKKCC